MFQQLYMTKNITKSGFGGWRTDNIYVCAWETNDISFPDKTSIHFKVPVSL